MIVLLVQNSLKQIQLPNTTQFKFRTSILKKKSSEYIFVYGKFIYISIYYQSAKSKDNNLEQHKFQIHLSSNQKV